MTPLETAAKAAFEHHYDDDDLDDFSWDAWPQDHAHWIASTRAALETLMEPTFEMVEEALQPDDEVRMIYMDDTWSAQQAHDDIVVRFKAMLTKVLEG